ncbi:MAG: hypothetical protein QOD74_2107 [Variibacter sp.]|nr:hypothetical protein [Variibacter sp.]
MRSRFDSQSAASVRLTTLKDALRESARKAPANDPSPRRAVDSLEPREGGSVNPLVVRLVE